MADIRERLAALGYAMPEPSAAVANYVPWVVTGGQVVVSGQLPFRDGTLAAKGAVPSAVTVEAAKDAAAWCAVNALAQVEQALDGDWDRLERVVRIGVFVCSDAGFAGQAGIANGASDLLVEALGERGRHARAAVGVIALPLGAAVEVELMVAVRGG
ncbi:MAG: RidA family protein [Planctomycetota bacterium]